MKSSPLVFVAFGAGLLLAAGGAIVLAVALTRDANPRAPLADLGSTDDLPKLVALQDKQQTNQQRTDEIQTPKAEAGGGPIVIGPRVGPSEKVPAPGSGQEMYG